ncbi:MAG TPA: hypothetical protein PK076_08350 [Saprospiraceae bacterium]|nr:hypothetical protein [Saprospiraceae bacterium]
MFKERHLLIATKHNKEKVIAPFFEKYLGVQCFVAPDLDTDKLGTFTGEIERKDDPITTARNKCLMAMELTGCDLVVASEGSFGPHPNIHFIPADDEFLIFIDKKNNLEIIAREIVTETNLNGSEIKTEKELQEFATNVKFPSHGLIIRKAKDDLEEIVKGITDIGQLYTVFHQFVVKHGTAYIETDMRAMYNPTRMKVIERATAKLVDKIMNRCPSCKMPGFGITDSIIGLPCEICKVPTYSTLSYIYTCQKCAFSIEKNYPNGKITEDPMYCNFCNP